MPAFALLLLEPAPRPGAAGAARRPLLANAGSPWSATLVAALAIQTRARDLIVPLLALPLLVPVVIAAARGDAPLLAAGGAERAPGALAGGPRAL